jgi:hypothetical protein
VTNASVSTPTVHRPAAWAFIVGAAGTTVAGVLIQTLVIPTTDVSEDRWSYPWEAGPFVAVSFVYIVLHLLVTVGLVAFGRSGVAGRSRAARSGVAIAVAGTLTLTVGEIIGLPIRDALTDDTSAQVVGAVFGLGVLLSAVGFVILGVATLRARVWLDWRRYTPLVTGIWTSILVVLPLAIPAALPGCVAIYGACLLAMAVALRRETRTSDDQSFQPVV